MNIKALLSCVETVTCHIEPANKFLFDVLWHLLQPIFLLFSHLLPMLITLFHQLIQYWIKICGFMLHVINASWNSRRDQNVKLCVPLYKSEISHEITKFAESLCLLKAQPCEPIAEHINSVVDIGKVLFNKVSNLIPLLPVHNLSNPMPERLVFINLLKRNRVNLTQFVSLGKLISIEIGVVKFFDKEEWSLMKIGFFNKHLFAFLLLCDWTFHYCELFVLTFVHDKLIKIVGKFAVLGFHNA